MARSRSCCRQTARSWPSRRSTSPTRPRRTFGEWALWVERLGPSATPAVSPHTPIRLAIAGRHGVPASASAVVFNLTVTRPDQAGFATAWPCGGPRPETSNLNWIGGQDRANLAFVPLDSTGEVCLAVDGRADFVVDVSGYLTGGADFVSGGPTWVYDSRSLPGGQRIAAGDVVRVGPFNGPTAMNITAVDAVEAGFATAWPCGAAMPDVSNNNFPAASASPSMALVTPGDGGHVCIVADKSAHLIVDLFGQFGTSVYTGGIPSRVLDTRAGLAAPPRPLAADEVLDLDVGEPGDVVALNVTITRPVGAGFLSLALRNHVARPRRSSTTRPARASPTSSSWRRGRTARSASPPTPPPTSSSIARASSPRAEASSAWPQCAVLDSRV